MEFPQRAVLRRHGTLALQHMNFNRILIVSRGRERFRLLGRNRRVARNHRRRHAAQGFNRKRQRSHVQQEQVFHFALEHAALNRRTNRDYFVGIHALVAFFAKQLLHQLLDRGMRVWPPTSTTSLILLAQRPHPSCTVCTDQPSAE